MSTYVNSRGHGLLSSYDSVRLVDQFTRTRNQGRNYWGILGVGKGATPKILLKNCTNYGTLVRKLVKNGMSENFFLPPPRQQFWERN